MQTSAFAQEPSAPNKKDEAANINGHSETSTTELEPEPTKKEPAITARPYISPEIQRMQSIAAEITQLRLAYPRHITTG